MEYLVIITMLILGHSKDIPIDCPGKICIEQIEQEMLKRNDAVRMRVFVKKDAGLLPLGGSIFPPLVDVYFK